MTPRLYVNLDHVATLREARGTTYPDVLEAALLAERSGHIHGVTLHLREDRRHVQDADVERVMAALKLPFNYELSCADEIVRHAERMRPAQATLVPERRAEITTEGGLDLELHGKLVGDTVARLQRHGVLVSLFIDPDAHSVKRSRELGATHVELHTGRYAHAFGSATAARELERLVVAAQAAQACGLVLNAGHGLTVANVGPVAALPGLNDLNIGHAIVAQAVFIGLEAALREMAQAIARGAITAPQHKDSGHASKQH
ncbi:MAG: pyridoxine 5'-phosphate synthase [Planctomycetes bacterium]|nr:pyridoxine 5'-phosphate synthase [Planctomycetota bacterium]